MRTKRSIIWKLDGDVFRNLVLSSTTIADALRKLNFALSSGNYRTINARIERDHIDCSHFVENRKELSRNGLLSKRIPTKNLLISNSTYSRRDIKRRLIDEGFLRNECSECGLQADWNGKRLVLVLDHINGIRDDNRLENLRLLCPNCNSQQNTFAGRNRVKKYFCSKCGAATKGHSSLCNKCSRVGIRKVVRPSKEQLEQEIRENSWVALGRKYGVSDNAVRKWAKQYDII